MANSNESDRIRTPFTSREREFLRSLSGYAKDNDLLNGYQRKVLYEGGHYNHVFIDRLARINDALGDIEEHLSTDDETYAYEIRTKGYRLFLTTRAGQGHAISQYLLGEAHYHGLYGLTEDTDEAVKWLGLAAKAGQGDAMLALGEHLLLLAAENDETISADAVTEAVEWLTAAVKANNYAAAYRLGAFYLDEDQAEYDTKRGLKFLRLAARNNETEAQADLGVLYEEGQHVRRSYKTAIAWYNKACEQGNHHGLLRLGLCYEQGLGVEGDHERAYKFFEDASENGNAYAAVRLGRCRRFGLGCDEDDAIAFEKFTEAAENDIISAYYWLGICHFYGEGTPQNYGESLINFEIATAAFPRAYWWIGELKRQGLGCREDTQAAFECFLHAVEHEVTDAKTALGRAFYFGEGVKADYVEAVKWLELGAQEDDSEAMYLLGMCHLGGDGVPENRKVGLRLLRDSASRGNGKAKEELDEMGFDLPKDNNIDGNVQEIGDRLLQKARVAYQKVTPPANMDDEFRKAGNVLKFSTSSRETLERMMRDHADDVIGDK
jgi:uncharacterized protein